jgi:hypothetical protein
MSAPVLSRASLSATASADSARAGCNGAVALSWTRNNRLSGLPGYHEIAGSSLPLSVMIMLEIDRIDVRMLTYRELCGWFALYTNLGCDARAEGMCIVFEMNMTAPEADTEAPHHKAA